MRTLRKIFETFLTRRDPFKCSESLKRLVYFASDGGQGAPKSNTRRTSTCNVEVGLNYFYFEGVVSCSSDMKSDFINQKHELIQVMVGL